MRRWLWLLGLSVTASAGAAVTLSPEGPATRDPNAQLQVLRDPGRALDAAAAWQAWQAGRFAPVADARASFGFTRDALWFHLRVENTSATALQRALVIEQPRLDRIEVHLRHDDGRRDVAVLGDSQPFAARSFAHRWPNHAFTLAPGAGADLLLRVESDSSIQLPLALLAPAELYRSTHGEQLGIGLYYGILLAL